MVSVPIDWPVVALVVSTLVTCAEISTFSETDAGLERDGYPGRFGDANFDAFGLGFGEAGLVHDDRIVAGRQKGGT